MAPYYDLLATQVYDTLEKHFAMSIGKTFRQDRIKATSFKGFANDLKIRPAKLAQIMDTVIRSIERNYETALARHEKKYGSAKIYSDLSRVISGNIKQFDAIQNDLV